MTALTRVCDAEWKTADRAAACVPYTACPSPTSAPPAECDVSDIIATLDAIHLERLSVQGQIESGTYIPARASALAELLDKEAALWDARTEVDPRGAAPAAVGGVRSAGVVVDPQHRAVGATDRLNGQGRSTHLRASPSAGPVARISISH